MDVQDNENMAGKEKTTEKPETIRENQ